MFYSVLIYYYTVFLIVLQTVTRLEPKFMAIHCQEVGGKNYEESMKHVKYFVRCASSMCCHVTLLPTLLFNPAIN